ncbi:MAG: lipocalin family protein [Clostridiales bacterium]|nr:lipocalin family protein [Clostridiales bacterium]
MRKKIAALMIIFCMLSFAACGGPGNSLIGSWGLDNGDETTLVTFNIDGTVLIEYTHDDGEIEQQTGTYTLEGEHLTVTEDGGDPEKAMISIDGDTLTLTPDDTPDEVLTLTRQK